jgi:hypothetical protein
MATAGDYTMVISAPDLGDRRPGIGDQRATAGAWGS